MARGSLDPEEGLSVTTEASGGEVNQQKMKEIRKWIRKLEDIARVVYIQKKKDSGDASFTGKKITAENYDEEGFNVENETLTGELGAIMDSSGNFEGLLGEKTKTLDFPRVSWNRAINRYILEKYVYALCLAEGKSTNDLAFIVDKLTELKRSARNKAYDTARPDDIKTKIRDEYSACINRKLKEARDSESDT